MFFKTSAVALGLASLSYAAPCDIYASGGTPCVAAHSTTRALYSAYSGKLYQVQRDSDGATTTINALSAGGVADAARQDGFCRGTTCVISVIYDQSGKNNHLTRAPPGGYASGPNANGYDDLAAAAAAPVTLNGKKAYGVFIHPTAGYRNNAAVGTATGDQPQGIYAIFDGTHYNGGCCFDYGNAETNSKDTGNGHMETVYFGTGTGGGTGAGSGPWVMADLENGIFGNQQLGGVNQNLPTINSQFVTAVVKGKPGIWSIRGGNPQSGGLSTWYNGTRPANGYSPMHKEGAIILGIGGDNSNFAQGTFYEGVMTSGYPRDATENAVQQNIVAAGYAKAPLTSGLKYTVGSSITFGATTPGCIGDYLAHNGADVSIKRVTSRSSTTDKQKATWVVRAGLAKAECYSFESADTPGSFLRHSNFKLLLNANDGSKLFGEDATYCPQVGFKQGSSIRSFSFPTRYFRHYQSTLYIASNGGPDAFDAKASFNDDATWKIGAGFA